MNLQKKINNQKRGRKPNKKIIYKENICICR